MALRKKYLHKAVLETWKNYLAIKHIVDRNPYATLQEIGTAIGLTRERVRQIIIESNNNPDMEPIERKPRRGGGFQAYCIECGKKLATGKKAFKTSTKTCRECLKAKPIVFFCTGCGKETVKSTPEEIARWKQNKKHVKNPSLNFCSLKCSGHWLGMNKGFGATKKREEEIGR